MTDLAQNEMKAKRGMPMLVRSMEGLGLRHLSARSLSQLATSSRLWLSPPQDL